MATSLILVTVDCLRADHVGCYGYPRPTTPFLDSLASESWRFERALVSGLPTYYSFPALLASRSPLALGRNVVGLAPGEATLATVLRDAGYSTAAFLAANPYLTRRDGYHQGFDHFEDFFPTALRPAGGGRKTGLRRPSKPRSSRPLTGFRKALRAFYEELYFHYGLWRNRHRARDPGPLRRYPHADRVVGGARSWLDRHPAEPFFLWIHLMDPHHPYYPPAAALELLGTDLPAREAFYLNSLWNRSGLSRRRLEKIRPRMVTLYDAGIRWVDEQLATLAAHLGDRWHRAAVVVTGDHGEEFLEHGGQYHYPAKMTRELVEVPLLIRSPGGGPEKTIPEPVGHLDLAPTLLGLLGVEPPASFTGRNRWRGDTVHGGTVAAELDPRVVVECIYDRREPWGDRDADGARLVAVQGRRYKLVVDFHHRTDRLFDLDADPEERAPLPDHRLPAVRAELLRHALEQLRRTRPDPASRPRLRAQLASIRRTLRT